MTTVEEQKTKKNLSETGSKTISEQIEGLKSKLDEASEEAKENIRSTINACTEQYNRAIDTNKKSAETLHQGHATDKFNYEKFIALQQKSFSESIELSTRDMKKIVEVYNKHINLSVNFSKRFSKNINTQIDTLVKFQSKGLQAYSNWVANWWEKDK